MEMEFEEFVRRVKDANPLEDVLEEGGFTLVSKRGRYVRGREHDSLVIDTHEQYYVWNSKGEKGDVFTWLERRNKWDFMASLKWLAERANIPMGGFGKVDQQTRLVARLREDVFGIAQRLMARWLQEDKHALEYCQKRGWTNETIQAAGLGFSGRATATQVRETRGEFAMYEIDAESPMATAILGYRGDVAAWGKRNGVIPQTNWIEWRMIPGLMGKTRLVYPHWVGGIVRYLSGRNILGADVDKQGQSVKSFNPAEALVGKRQMYYNHVYSRRADECVIVEGQADAVTLGQWGIAAVALAGTGWKDHQYGLMEMRQRHKRLYLAMDADKAGRTALIGERGDWPMISTLGPMTLVLSWGEGDDSLASELATETTSDEMDAEEGEVGALVVEEVGEAEEEGNMAALDDEDLRRMAGDAI